MSAKNELLVRENFVENLENIPNRLLEIGNSGMGRFLPNGKEGNYKHPLVYNWKNKPVDKTDPNTRSRPDLPEGCVHNTMTLEQALQYDKVRSVGFILQGHLYPDCFDVDRTEVACADFDDVLDPDTGKWLYPRAKEILEQILALYPNLYVEVSLSRKGLHVFFVPTKNWFPEARSGGLIYFTEKRSKNAPKIELFWLGEGRQIILTGNKYEDPDDFTIYSGDKLAEGEAADQIMQYLIDNGNATVKANVPATIDITANSTISSNIGSLNDLDTNGSTAGSPEIFEYERAKAIELLDLIICSSVDRDTWFHITTVLKKYELYDEWVAWCSTDPDRFISNKDQKENQDVWNSIKEHNNYSVGVLVNEAKRQHDINTDPNDEDAREAWHQIFNEKAFREQWCCAHPEFNIRAIVGTESLKLEYDRNGIVLKTIDNFVMILQNDSGLSGLIAFDLFTHKMIKKKTAPWEQLSNTTREWSDNDEAHLRYYIEREYSISPNKKLDDAIIVVAEQNAFHPVREYLANLPNWDGVERAETLFIRVLEVPDNAYSRSISFHWLKAAIHRVLKHGCKFDYCLVIAGKQGVGKSSLFAKLGGGWFNDSIENINGKDAIEQLIGSWIIELGEMQATRKADNETIKAFISRTTDRIRLPYAHRSIDFPRQCVFAATTNDDEPLKDKTGGRRFWILKSLASSATASERMNILDDTYIQQVWAEVYYKYDLERKATGKIKLLPPSEILVEATKIQEELTEGSEMIDLIRNYLDTPIPEKTIWDSLTKKLRQDFIKNGALSTEVNKGTDPVVGTDLRQEVCSAEVAYELFDIDNLNKEKTTLREINTILSNLDNWHKHSGGKRMGIYGSQKNVYVRENPFV